MGRDHTIHRHAHHFAWDRDIPAVETVAPGDCVRVEMIDASGGQITPESTVAVFDAYDGNRVNPVTGPIRVDGAAPGDALAITIDNLAPSGWGWTANIPGFGLLADDFPIAALRHWEFDMRADKPLPFGDIAAIPQAPFIGTIGLAPAESGPHSIIPPRRVGGNMDIRDFTTGSTLYLPVEVEGALLSVGDGHAAQGDGEVCGTAIECAMTAHLSIELIKDGASRMPRLIAPQRKPQENTLVHIATGIGPDLHEAARTAVREMIDLLGVLHGISAIDAYMLCSVAGDLRISQIVDAPNWTVSFHLPDSIFSDKG